MKRELKELCVSPDQQGGPLTKLIPMKRELKGKIYNRNHSIYSPHKANPYEKGTERGADSVSICMSLHFLTKLIPMKRELKAALMAGSMEGNITHKANPYEKGTERRHFLLDKTCSATHKANPYEKGTESL